MSEEKTQTKSANAQGESANAQGESANAQTGKLSVATENIFPIIKKWLYSDEDIFLRELISNSYDAIKKISHLEDIGEYKGKREEGKIDISINKKDRKISIVDNGIGMDSDEVQKYINQIAFSGASEFIKNYENSEGIIGHFGLGFFSAFMVSSKVELNTLSYKKGAKAVSWECDGETEFTMKEGQHPSIGTEIILHIDKEHDHILDEAYIKNLIIKYSNFLPLPISLNGKVVNSQNPLWQKKATAIKEEEYKKFYEGLFPGKGEPLLHIHIDTEFPFRLKGILFFPEVKNEFDLNEDNKVGLYCNNVFVSDNVSEILPKHLSLLHGAIDSPDIPLNVSRSALQTDQKVKKIAQHIVKKVTDALKAEYKKDRKKYEQMWEKIHPIVKFSCVSDADFLSKVKDVLLFKKESGGYCTLSEYEAENSKLKNKAIYTTDADGQVMYIEAVKKENVEVLLMDHRIDNHFLQSLEMANADFRFVRVDSDVASNLIGEGEIKEEDKKKFEGAKGGFESYLKKKEVMMGVEIGEMQDEDTPAVLVVDEQMRRFGEMSSMSTGQSFSPMFGKLILNRKNKIISRINALENFAGKDTEKAAGKDSEKMSAKKGGRQMGK